MTQLIGILAVLCIIVLIGLLFLPVLRDRSGGDFYRTGMTLRKQRQTRHEFLMRRLADLDLDRDSGKLSPDEHAHLVKPLQTEIEAVESEMKERAPESRTATQKKKSELLTFLIIAVASTLFTRTLSAIPITIEGRITNGTTAHPTRVEKIELLKIQEGMQTVETLTDAGPHFRFKAVDPGNAPLLVRASYQGDTFVSVIPPGEDRQRTGNRTDITVFDRGASIDSVEFHSGLQISRLRQGLDVTLVYAINNHSEPPRSFDISTLKFPVPADAQDLRVSVAHQTGGMPVTLTPESLTGGIKLNRALRPGMSELSIRFKTDSHTFVDRIDFTKDILVNRGEGTRPFFRVLIWRPDDAKPQITGGDGKELDVPNLGKAMQVTYSSDEVTYEFNTGGVWFENPMTSDDNPIFDHPWKTIIGILLAFVFLLLLLSILTGSRIRLTRSGE